MDYFFAIIAGVIQGLTEFLPVSSSGHLVLFHDVFGFNLPDDLFFDVILHWGTFFALVLFFYRDIEKIIRGFFSSLFNWNLKNNFNQRLSWLVIIGTVPAVIVGYFLEDIIVSNLRAVWLVAVFMIVVAALFWIFERIAKRQKDLQAVTKMDALIIGIAQAIALIPGVSRSGITIIAGLGRKLKRSDAARFSFLLSLPIVLGAGLKKMFEAGSWTDANLAVLALGFFFSLVTGYLAIKILLRYLNNHSLNIFAWYRLIIGCLILIWLIFF